MTSTFGAALDAAQHRFHRQQAAVTAANEAISTMLGHCARHLEDLGVAPEVATSTWTGPALKSAVIDVDNEVCWPLFARDPLDQLWLLSRAGKIRVASLGNREVCPVDPAGTSFSAFWSKVGIPESPSTLVEKDGRGPEYRMIVARRLVEINGEFPRLFRFEYCPSRPIPDGTTAVIAPSVAVFDLGTVTHVEDDATAAPLGDLSCSPTGVPYAPHNAGDPLVPLVDELADRVVLLLDTHGRHDPNSRTPRRDH